MTQDMQSIIEQQKANCPFCKIIKGGIPSKKIFENSDILAILDINPAAQGHVLIMPKDHYPIMPLIPKEVLNDLFITVTRIADIEKFLFLKQGTTIFIANGAVAGQQSSHFMVHIIPRDEADVKQLNLTLRDVDREKTDKISSRLSDLMSARLKEEYEKFPLLDQDNNPIPLKRKFSKEYVIQIIEQNPQLKEALIAEPEQFKNAVPLNPQLSAIFEGIDIDEILEHFVPENRLKEHSIEDTHTHETSLTPSHDTEEEPNSKKEEVKKESTVDSDTKFKEEQKDKADLDLVSRLFR